MARENESKYFFIDTTDNDKERYDLGNFMLFDEDFFDVFTSNALDEIPKLPIGGRIVVAGDDFRPDAISYKIYGSTQYYWVILVYNRIQSVNDIENGQELLYPTIGALEDYLFGLNVQQSESDRN